MTPNNANKEVPDHNHDGKNSRRLNTAAFLKSVSATPDWVGREGELVWGNDGSTYKIYVWLNGAWRSATLT